MMREADGWHGKAGRSVLIFPEGTRVPPGEHPPLKAGLCGPVPDAEDADGADRLRQRAGVAAAWRETTQGW